MTHLIVAASTDVGRVRSANEDAYLTGDSIFAVADGMGGHAAGEVASSTALRPIASLDGRVFPDATEAIDALRSAVVEANNVVGDRARDEPELRGMGTTLTAILIEGRRLHLAHVGDSRAYLLRDDQFEQITIDHTLVQHLIDEGQITRAEAATHPQRSVITRAIGVSGSVDVDVSSFELGSTDQVLLCSDGLTGVVSDDVIADVLRGTVDAKAATRRLVELANEHGGPDNITVVLVRGSDAATAIAASGTGPGDTGDLRAAGPGTAPLRVSSAARTDSDDDWAARVGRLGALGRAGDPDDEPRRGVSTGQRVLAVSLVSLALIVAAFGSGRWLLSRSYYVGIEGERVAIYKGIPSSLGPLELSWLEERTTLALGDVAEYHVDDLRRGIAAADLADARRIVQSTPLRGSFPTGPEQQASDEPTDSPSPSPGTSPGTTTGGSPTTGPTPAANGDDGLPVPTSLDNATTTGP